MNDNKEDRPIIVSVHPEAGLDDLSHSAITWGALVDPGLALLVQPPAGRAADLSRPLRLLAGASSGPLLDAPVTRTLDLRSSKGVTYLVMQADLADWTGTGQPPWSPTTGDVLDDETAALADQLLNRCAAPDETWYDHAAKARAAQVAPPHPYPFRFPPIPQPPTDRALMFGRPGHVWDPTWHKLFSQAFGWHR